MMNARILQRCCSPRLVALQLLSLLPAQDKEHGRSGNTWSKNSGSANGIEVRTRNKRTPDTDGSFDKGTVLNTRTYSIKSGSSATKTTFSNRRICSNAPLMALLNSIKSGSPSTKMTPRNRRICSNAPLIALLTRSINDKQTARKNNEVAARVI
jgi:hypothetical protein